MEIITQLSKLMLCQKMKADAKHQDAKERSLLGAQRPSPKPLIYKVLSHVPMGQPGGAKKGRAACGAALDFLPLILQLDLNAGVQKDAKHVVRIGSGLRARDLGGHTAGQERRLLVEQVIGAYIHRGVLLFGKCVA